MNTIAPYPTESQFRPAAAPDHRKFFFARKLPAWLGALLCVAVLGAATSGLAASIWNDATVPANPAADDPNAVEVGLKFRSDVAGYITGIRFYKGPGNNGTHVGNLWTANGVLLASTTFGAETASGWQQQALPAPVPISANTTYVVSYHAPQGQYAADVGYFAVSGVVNNPLTALANGVAGPNGVYAYGPSGTFPNQTFNAANYWVDVVFEETVGADTTPPTVVSVLPAAGATGVSVATTVTVTFSEPMDSASIDGNSVRLRDAADNPVAATVTYSAASQAAVLTPTAPLNAAQIYTVTVAGGVAGVKDLAGNPLTSTLTATFTTSGGATLVSIWDDSVTPTILSANDPDAIELGMKFQSAEAGAVTGIRFYKGPDNVGPHIGNLWTADGTLLASVLFENETAMGWQTQALPAAVPIEANTVYVVSYYAPFGGYAVDLGYFAGGGVNRDPLRALADGEAGGNGVYAYGLDSTFPNQTFSAANYWVDVVVAIPTDSGCEGDVTPPTLVVPRDVILTGTNCDTDPSITGMATATDDCSVTVTYRDKVSEGFATVVKRVWMATDGAGNVTRAVQTITCIPTSVVTDSAGCLFDRDPATAVQDFRLIFIQDARNRSCFKLVASNPGQFVYNVLYTGTPGSQVTFNVSVPYPFVTQGAKPIRAYDGVSVVTWRDQQRLVPGKEFFAGTPQISLANYGKPPSAHRTIPVKLKVPASGVILLTVHLDYGFKKMTGFGANANVDAIACATGAGILIPNHGNYEFKVAGAQTGHAVIQNQNDFKRIPGLAAALPAGLANNPLLKAVAAVLTAKGGNGEDAGVAGLVTRKANNAPVQGAVVTLSNNQGIPMGFAVTDRDGYYRINYKNVGKAAAHRVTVGTPPPKIVSQTKTVNLKANDFMEVDFLVP